MSGRSNWEEVPTCARHKCAPSATRLGSGIDYRVPGWVRQFSRWIIKCEWSRVGGLGGVEGLEWRKGVPERSRLGWVLRGWCAKEGEIVGRLADINSHVVVTIKIYFSKLKPNERILGSQMILRFLTSSQRWKLLSSCFSVAGTANFTTTPTILPF